MDVQVLHGESHGFQALASEVFKPGMSCWYLGSMDELTAIYGWKSKNRGTVPPQMDG